MREAAFVLAGLASGAFSGALGLGGAILATPLIRFLGVSPHLAIGTTVPVLFPTTLTGAWTYRRAGLVDDRGALLTALPAAATAVAGAFTTRLVNGHVLMLMTAAILLLLALRTLPGRSPSEREPAPPRRTAGPFVAVGAVSGFFSGLLGVGGGFVMVPVFIRILRLPVKVALGTSLAVIALTSVPNLVAQSVVGNVDWKVAVLLALGVIPGARAGARLAIRASERKLQVAVVVCVVAVGLAYALTELAALFSP